MKEQKREEQEVDVREQKREAIKEIVREQQKQISEVEER